MKACVAAVFAFGLAACSSSGSDTPPAKPETEEKPMPMPEPEPEPQALDIPAGGDLGGASNVGLGPVSKDGDTSTLSLAAGASATRGNVTFTCPESATDGCTVTFTNEAGRIEVSELGGVEASIPPRDPATVGVPPAIGTDVLDINDTLTVKVTRGTDRDASTPREPAPEFEVGHKSYPDATDEGLTELPLLLSRWPGPLWHGVTGDLQIDGDADLDPDPFKSAGVKVHILTNIEEATSRDFFEKYPATSGEANNGGTDSRYYRVPADADPSLLVNIPNFDTGADAEPAAGADPFTFDSIPGTFTCQSGPCSIAVVDGDPFTEGDQLIAQVVGVIHFVPATNADQFHDVQDADYLTLGAWNHMVGGAVIETAATYAASQPLTADGRSMLTARGLTAEEEFIYKGFTIGSYYKETEDPNGVVTEGPPLLYDALVELTATFAPEGDTLEGEVTSLNANDGIDGIPDLILGKTDLSASFAASGQAGSAPGTNPFDGTWAAQFVGDGTSIGGTYSVSRGSDADNTLERFDGAFGADEEQP